MIWTSSTLHCKWCLVFISYLFNHSYCGIRDPSWAELRHFVSFLNIQLHDCELSAYCGLAAADILPGFLTFVVKFMIQMSTVSTTSTCLARIKQELCIYNFFLRLNCRTLQPDLYAYLKRRQEWYMLRFVSKIHFQTGSSTCTKRDQRHYQVFVVFLKKNVEDTSPFLMQLIPLFWTSGDVLPGHYQVTFRHTKKEVPSCFSCTFTRRQKYQRKTSFSVCFRSVRLRLRVP